MPNDYPILVSPPTAQRSTATLMKTGQTTSYRTGDDGDLERGRLTDFFTLAENNPFGNTNRFTDELGGQDYTNNIVIDWSTFNGSTVLGWYRIVTPNKTWSQAIDETLLLTISTFTGWHCPNNTEFASLFNWELSVVMNYSPISISSTCWSSNTYKLAAAFAWNSGTNGSLTYTPKTSTLSYVANRYFTVTGTTLT